MSVQTQQIRSRVQTLPVILCIGLIGVTLFVLTLPSGVRDLLFLGALAGGLLLALSRFILIWTIVLALLPFVGLFEAILGQDKFAAARLILFGMFLAFLLQPRAARSFARALRRPEFVAFAMFVGMNVLSGFVSGEIESVFRALTYVEPLLFYLLTFHVVTMNPTNLKAVLFAIILGGGVAVLFGLVEILTQRPIIVSLNIPFHTDELLFYMATNRFGLSGRITSTIGQPVYTALYFTTWLFVTIYYVRVFAPKSKWLLYLIVPLGALVMLATGTLAMYFALVPTVFILVLLYVRNVRVVLLLLAGVLLFGVGIYVLLPGLLNFGQAAITLDPAQRESANAIGRVTLTEGFIQVFMKNPLFGNGPGLIQKGARAGDLPQILQGLENQYAVILGDGGLAAGLTYLVFMGTTFAFAWRMLKSHNRVLRASGVLLCALLVFYFTIVVSVMAVVSEANSVLMVVLGGFAASYRALREPRAGPRLAPVRPNPSLAEPRQAIGSTTPPK